MLKIAESSGAPLPGLSVSPTPHSGDFLPQSVTPSASTGSSSGNSGVNPANSSGTLTSQSSGNSGTSSSDEPAAQNPLQSSTELPNPEQNVTIPSTTVLTSKIII